MPVLATKKNCTGCNACFSACPHNAIVMNADGMGFHYPYIESNKCVECKLCERVCPIIYGHSEHPKFKQEYFAAQMSNFQKLSHSQSGGAFQAIATKILEEGGIVYGAAFNNNLTVKHIRITDIDNLDDILGSKYVQSDISDTMLQAKSDLYAGYIVLFSGTPCQIAGLKRFIPYSLQTNLLTIDLICHGVPSPAVYEKYRIYLEDKYGKKIKQFIFRDKNSFGWKTPRESIIFNDDTKMYAYNYNFLFQEKDLIARPACGNCRFCSLDRQGDITVADCWGWDKLSIKVFDEDRGISLILINSSKGKFYFQEVSKSLKSISVSLSPHLLQRNLKYPTERPKLADKVALEFEKYGFEYIHRKYGYTKRNLRHYKLLYYIGAIRRRLKKLIKI